VLDAVTANRVLSLDPRAETALPYLYTRTELDAHCLLAQYSHGWSEAVAVEADSTGPTPVQIQVCITNTTCYMSACTFSLVAWARRQTAGLATAD
jgi:hypothetical protein